MVEQVLRGSVADVTAPASSHSKSAASWPAIIAGAFVATSASLILLALGSGLGFATVSPWPNRGVSGMSFAITAAIWLIVTQWLSAALGGYIAGRLRTRWIGTHTHEVFFRDTAHGLITWAVATVLVAVTLSTTFFASIGASLHAGATVASEGEKDMMSSPMSPSASYNLDRLLRPAETATNAQPLGLDPRPEVAHIIAHAALTGGVPDTDRAYLAQLVTMRTGIPQQDAQKRVDDFLASTTDAAAKAKAVADEARKAAAEASIYLALSLLVGAFIASASAALGGRLRDEHP